MYFDIVADLHVSSTHEYEKLVSRILSVLYYICIMYYVCMCASLHVSWIPCHHDMAHTQVADGGDGLQMRIYGINSLGQPTRGGPTGRGLGVGVTTPHRK
jgi:hypothetical protein